MNEAQIEAAVRQLGIELETLNITVIPCIPLGSIEYRLENEEDALLSCIIDFQITPVSHDEDSFICSLDVSPDTDPTGAKKIFEVLFEEINLPSLAVSPAELLTLSWKDTRRAYLERLAEYLRQQSFKFTLQIDVEMCKEALRKQIAQRTSRSTVFPGIRRTTVAGIPKIIEEWSPRLMIASKKGVLMMDGNERLKCILPEKNIMNIVKAAMQVS